MNSSFPERASGESAWLLLVYQVHHSNRSWRVLVSNCIIIGIISSWLLVAKKIRQETEKYNALTIPDYFHKKYKIIQHN